MYVKITFTITLFTENIQKFNNISLCFIVKWCYIIEFYFLFLFNIVYILLSEYILCKANIVIVKELDYEILTYFYVFRSPEFMFAVFIVMDGCVYVCVYEIENDVF